MKLNRIAILCLVAGSMSLVNSCKKDSTTTLDTTAPVITLKGSNPFVISSIGTTFTDPGYTATDNVDGDITSSVLVDASSFNKDSAGTYVITYSVDDKAGNSATDLTRQIVVNNSLETSGYKGTYAATDLTSGVTTNYTDVVSYSNAVNGRIKFGKFADYQNGVVYADINGGSVTVPAQDVVCGTVPVSRHFSGSGTISTAGGTTTIVLNITELTNGTSVTSTETYTK